MLEIETPDEKNCRLSISNYFQLAIENRNIVNCR
jgi:hypothetical protein